jgi:hypothetical protein
MRTAFIRLGIATCFVVAIFVSPFAEHCITNSKSEFFWACLKLFRRLLRLVVSRIVSRAEVFHRERPDGRYLRDVLAGFRPVKMGSVSRENDHGTGRIGLQFIGVEFIAQSDMKDAGNYGINSIL